mmetsp:Transcript_21406/g.22888  ORF Transcript_21406/g.22888 Transcript_21406/m.22888 type:complete len:315 (+) Transcript_21406:289-1233(+)
MRLYDQRSSTPIFSERKKSMRPFNFLPDRTENIGKKSGITVDNDITEPNRVWKDNCSETSASASIEISKIYKHNTIHDDFRFDIDKDQEFSINSSSTLSTHSTFQQMTKVLYGGNRTDFLELGQTADRGETESDLFKFSITRNSYQSPVKRSSNIATDYLSNINNDYSSYDADEFFTPELTLTESSEESIWLDFPGFGTTINNPFRTAHDTNKYSKKKRLLNPYQVPHKTSPIKNSPRSNNNEASPPCNIDKKDQAAPEKSPTMYQGTRNYTKYLTSLVQGISVNDVSKAMKSDKIDPSIISLVLAANKASRSV